MSEHVCRRLIVFLDGTWNEDTEARPATNIVYLRELLFRGLSARLRRIIDDKKAGVPNPDNDLYDKLPERFRKKGVKGLVFDGYEYIVYYDRGVGTGFMDRIKGGVTGAGLNKNIREAYRFLSNWYRPGDEIYVFGFSRGAYTARSLCGYMQAIGLLRREACTPENEERAWQFYRRAPGDRLSGEWSWFNDPHEGKTNALMHDNRLTRIRALCVFDTVGALGVPAGMLRRLNQTKYSFHDTDVNSLVDIRLHALAIDEPRRSFKPSLWTKPKFKFVDIDDSPTAQVWFSGAHSDVGGGYANWAAHETGMSLVPLAWMVQKLNYYVINTPPTAYELPTGLAVVPNPQTPIPFDTEDLLQPDTGPGRSVIKKDIQDLVLSATQHKPWAAFYIVPGIANRRVLNQLTPGKKPVASSGRVAFADPFCELVHVSALQRLGQKVEIDKGRILNLLGKRRTYRPRNLKDMVPYLAATYVRNVNAAPDSPWRKHVEPIQTWKQSYIVDWDGMALDPEDDAQAERAFKLLPDPVAVGVTKMPGEMLYIREKRNGSVAGA